jgi:hypothetical protein
LFVIKPYKTTDKPYQSYVTVYNEMKAYISKDKDDYRYWFVGTTATLERTLFAEHRVYEKDDSYIFRECPTDRAAENVRASLIRLGCDGEAGGWTDAQTIVYAYRKSFHTKPGFNGEPNTAPEDKPEDTIQS